MSCFFFFLLSRRFYKEIIREGIKTSIGYQCKNNMKHYATALLTCKVCVVSHTFAKIGFWKSIFSTASWLSSNSLYYLINACRIGGCQKLVEAFRDVPKEALLESVKDYINRSTPMYTINITTKRNFVKCIVNFMIRKLFVCICFVLFVPE